MAISLQQLTIYLYSAHRAVIFAIAQLSCSRDVGHSSAHVPLAIITSSINPGPVTASDSSLLSELIAVAKFWRCCPPPRWGLNTGWFVYRNFRPIVVSGKGCEIP